MTGLPGARSATSLVSIGAYVALLLFGAAQGLIGGFQYSRLAPVGAILFAVGIFATCLAAGWAMQSITGAFMPGVGWVIASFVLAQPMSNGSVIIANTAPGQWFLYGGTLGAVGAAVIVFTLWVRVSRRQLGDGLLDLVHAPVEVGLGDDQRRSQPDRRAVGLLGQDAVLGQPFARLAPAE
jgi:hypothetical protein